MTKEEAKQWIPILQAYSEGKEIEMKASNDVWIGQRIWHFGSLVSDYRIKPTPTFRPWKPEEVPIQAMFRKKGHNGWSHLLGMDGAFLQFCCGSSNMYVGLGTAFEEAEYSTDFGKTWQPCGILE